MSSQPQEEQRDKHPNPGNVNPWQQWSDGKVGSVPWELKGQCSWKHSEDLGTQGFVNTYGWTLLQNIRSFNIQGHHGLTCFQNIPWAAVQRTSPREEAAAVILREGDAWPSRKATDRTFLWSEKQQDPPKREKRNETIYLSTGWGNEGKEEIKTELSKMEKS